VVGQFGITTLREYKKILQCIPKAGRSDTNILASVRRRHFVTAWRKLVLVSRSMWLQIESEVRLAAIHCPPQHAQTSPTREIDPSPFVKYIVYELFIITRARRMRRQLPLGQAFTGVCC